MKRTRKSQEKGQKVTFESVAHHLPEGYFEQYEDQEDNDYCRKEFEKRIQKANRSLGTKSPRELNCRSTWHQKAFIEIREFAQKFPDLFDQLCEEIRVADSLETKSNREAAYSKIKAKYIGLPCKNWRVDILELCKSLKPFHTYSELL